MLCVAIIAYCSTPTIIYLGLLYEAHKSIGIGSVGASRGCDQRFFGWITTPYSDSQDSTELYLSYFSFYIIDGRLSQVRLCFGSRSAFRSFRRVLRGHKGWSMLSSFLLPPPVFFPFPSSARHIWHPTPPGHASFLSFPSPRPGGNFCLARRCALSLPTILETPGTRKGFRVLGALLPVWWDQFRQRNVL